MTIGTLALLFIVPTLFIAFQWLQERIRPVQAEPTHDWQIEEEIVASDREKKEAKGGALKGIKGSFHHREAQSDTEEDRLLV